MILEEVSSRAAFREAIRDASGWVHLREARVQPLEELLATVEDERFPGAIVPRLKDGSILHYALAESNSQWRQLQPLLMASIGMTLTDFAGDSVELEETDSFELLIKEQNIPVIARFSAHGDRNLAKAAVDALVRLKRSLSRSEARNRSIPRTTAQVLHEFRMAVSVLDRHTAEDAIRFLRQNMRLDALNLYFLEVQLEASFREWDRLVRRPFFGSLCQTRRPPQVTAAMVEAIYNTTLLSAELADDPALALEVFRRNVVNVSGTLFDVCPPEPRPTAGKAFLLAALASHSPNRSLITDLTERAVNWPAGEGLFFSRLMELLPSETEDAHTAVVTGANYHAQLDAAGDTSVKPSPERARAVLVAASEVQTLEAYRTAIEYVGRLSPVEQEELESSTGFGAMLVEIRQYAGQRGVPRNWLEWAEQLSDLSFGDARAFAEKAVDEWPVARHLQRPADVDTLVEALVSAAGNAEEQLYDALPHLVSWVQSDEYWPNPNYRLLYKQILELVLLGNRRASSALRAASLMLDGLLSLGMDSEDYSRILNDVRGVLPEMSGARNVDWLLDLSEIIVTNPCMDEEARRALWSQVLFMLNQLGSRLSPSQAALTVDLCAVLGMQELLNVPEAASKDISAEVRNYSSLLVTIYTLTESVGQRSARLLSELYPGIRVEHLHDLVSNTRVEELIRNADLFVVCWSSAKHAVTDAIRRKRPAALTTIYVPGGGSSSLLREVAEHIESLATPS